MLLPASPGLSFPAVQFYQMAVKDVLCKGARTEGLSSLDLSKGGYCKKNESGSESGSVSGAVSETWSCDFDKDCSDEKWVGAPDKEDDFDGRAWDPSPCEDGAPVMWAVIPFVWYFIFYLCLLGYLIFHIYSFKEELAKAPSDDTEMGARPAVATAVATATPAVAAA